MKRQRTRFREGMEKIEDERMRSLEDEKKTQPLNPSTPQPRNLLTSVLTAYCSLLTVHCLAKDTIQESLSDLSRILPAKKITNEPWGRDPFMPLVGDGFMQPAHFRLMAIIYNDKKPSAIVNDKILSIGDSIDGQKVIDITRQYVILHGSSGTYKLQIGNAGGQSYDIRKSR